ncbi:hypothetical protein Geob_2375 [Geotalea daltonii FRC-32]|uniref:Uncharacterized protein n=1 Tax=Geotalea daltonii (strain DSM 22248 / JCM 15807 / FRC-32) TaxID=316067 RepID=B9LZH6_GEODF|nr:DUF2959 family protein [Geotalea daltonii]ACM20729.1 hypothetical protein Geob_2375 [Geotalea daltonii FRC-32]
MKVKTRFGIIVTTLLLGSTAYLNGCATMGMGKGEAAKTTTKVQAAETGLKQTLAQVDATQASLDSLIEPGQADVKNKFDAYSADVEKMDKMAKQLEKDQSKMQEQQREYLAEWEKKERTYTDPSLREASGQRRAALNSAYSEVPKASTQFQDALNGYLSQIKQIQTQLSLDLTNKGIESITPAAQKALSDGGRLKDTAEPVITAMERVMSEMAREGSGAAAGGQ